MRFVTHFNRLLFLFKVSELYIVLNWRKRYYLEQSGCNSVSFDNLKLFVSSLKYFFNTKDWRWVNMCPATVFHVICTGPKVLNHVLKAREVCEVSDWLCSLKLLRSARGWATAAHYFGFQLCTRGLHWDWVPPGPAGPISNLAGAGGMNFAAGGSGQLKEKTAGSAVLPGVW